MWIWIIYGISVLLNAGVLTCIFLCDDNTNVLTLKDIGTILLMLLISPISIFIIASIFLKEYGDKPVFDLSGIKSKVRKSREPPVSQNTPSNISESDKMRA